MDVAQRMSIDYLTNSNVTPSISNSSTSAFTPYQSNKDKQTVDQSFHIFNPATHVVTTPTTPLQERLGSQEQNAQNEMKTAHKVASMPLPLPFVPYSSHSENYSPWVCNDCITREWKKNPNNEQLTLMMLPIIYKTHDWLKAQKICLQALKVNPQSVELLNAYQFIKNKMGEHLQMITNSKTLHFKTSYL